MTKKEVKRIKILYGVECASGGVIKHLMYLVSSLNKEFEIDLIYSDARLDTDHYLVEKLSDYKIGLYKINLKRNISIFSDLKALIKVYKIIKNNKYDVVHAHSSKAGFVFRIAAYLNKVEKIFYTPHCFYFQSKSGAKKYLFTVAEKILALFCHKLILSENEIKEAIKFKIAKKNQIVNINNACNFILSENDSNSLSFEELRIGSDMILVGCVGRLSEQKGWITYIKAAMEVLKEFRDVVFVIIGEGEQKYVLKEIVKNLKLEEKIIFTGHIRDANKIYPLLNIYVQSSNWEGLPYSLIEAINFKIPVVVTSCGLEEYIKDGSTGMVAEVGDYKAIAQKIKSLIINKDFRVNLSLNAFGMAKEKFSYKSFVEKHKSLYYNGEKRFSNFSDDLLMSNSDSTKNRPSEIISLVKS